MAAARPGVCLIADDNGAGLAAFIKRLIGFVRCAALVIKGYQAIAPALDSPVGIEGGQQDFVDGFTGFAAVAAQKVVDGVPLHAARRPASIDPLDLRRQRFLRQQAFGRVQQRFSGFWFRQQGLAVIDMSIVVAEAFDFKKTQDFIFVFNKVAPVGGLKQGSGCMEGDFLDFAV